MNTFMCFLVIMMRIREKILEDEQMDFFTMKCVYDVVNLDPKNKSGETLLHLAVSPETNIDEFHTKDIVSFPR